MRDIEEIRSTMTWDDLERFKAYARLFAEVDGIKLSM